MYFNFFIKYTFNFLVHLFIGNLFLFIRSFKTRAQLAGARGYTDCLSAER